MEAMSPETSRNRTVAIAVVASIRIDQVPGRLQEEAGFLQRPGGQAASETKIVGAEQGVDIVLGPGCVRYARRKLSHVGQRPLVGVRLEQQDVDTAREPPHPIDRVARTRQSAVFDQSQIHRRLPDEESEANSRVENRRATATGEISLQGGGVVPRVLVGDAEGRKLPPRLDSERRFQLTATSWEAKNG